jgi:hypothetical protein
LCVNTFDLATELLNCAHLFSLILLVVIESEDSVTFRELFTVIHIAGFFCRCDFSPFTSLLLQFLLTRCHPPACPPELQGIVRCTAVRFALFSFAYDPPLVRPFTDLDNASLNDALSCLATRTIDTTVLQHFDIVFRPPEESVPQRDLAPELIKRANASDLFLSDDLPGKAVFALISAIASAQPISSDSRLPAAVVECRVDYVPRFFAETNALQDSCAFSPNSSFARMKHDTSLWL